MLNRQQVYDRLTLLQDGEITLEETGLVQKCFMKFCNGVLRVDVRSQREDGAKSDD